MDHSLNLDRYKEFAWLGIKVIERHQREEADSRVLAIDKLGLSLIDVYHGPYKLNFQLQHVNQPTFAQYCQDFLFSELQELTGRLPYGLLLGNGDSAPYNLQ